MSLMCHYPSKFWFEFCCHPISVMLPSSKSHAAISMYQSLFSLSWTVWDNLLVILGTLTACTDHLVTHNLLNQYGLSSFVSSIMHVFQDTSCRHFPIINLCESSNSHFPKHMLLVQQTWMHFSQFPCVNHIAIFLETGIALRMRPVSLSDFHWQSQGVKVSKVPPSKTFPGLFLGVSEIFV